jgi:metal-sulfur cluster biosynthetic enzyme
LESCSAPCRETPSRIVQTPYDRERHVEEPQLSEEEQCEQEEDELQKTVKSSLLAGTFGAGANWRPLLFWWLLPGIIQSMNAGSIMSEENGTTPPVTETAPAAGTTGVVSEDQVKLALRRVKDPDLQLNIIDLGLVYAIAVDGTTVKVDMTLTSPACPSGPELMTNAETEVKSLPGVEKVEVNLVWMPFWTPEKMEPRVRAYLGF